jgi:hypothetical protein
MGNNHVYLFRNFELIIRIAFSNLGANGLQGNR